MKLFLATNQLTTETKNIRMLEVAVKSALKNTNFEVFVLFDGKKEKLNLPNDVNIIEHKHRCFDTFKDSIRCFKNEECLKTASGAFLRTEIPHIFKLQNFDDEYCLYTDYDVLFLPGNYSDLEDLKPKTFASSTEFSPYDWSYVNTGVMIKNIKFFEKQDDFIINFINNNFEKLDTWDQTMYNFLFQNQWDKLPVEYNWKPYWGINPESKIIHFHGPKPYVISSEDEINNVEILKKLHNFNVESYKYYNEIFNSFL